MGQWVALGELGSDAQKQKLGSLWAGFCRTTCMHLSATTAAGCITLALLHWHQEQDLALTAKCNQIKVGAFHSTPTAWRLQDR